LGSSADRTLTITNTGAGTLTGTVISPCADYSIVGTPSYSLGSGASTTITVHFAPAVSGTRSCVIDTGDASCADVSCSGTGLELSSGFLAPGGTYPHTFMTAGSYPYHCEIHTVMRGTVIVDPASLVTSVSVSIVNATASGFSPGSVTVAPGGTVTWTNNHSSTHTVTSD
jgi:plastocyanin